jgi:hypothetical protein
VLSRLFVSVVAATAGLQAQVSVREPEEEEPFFGVDYINVMPTFLT